MCGYTEAYGSVGVWVWWEGCKSECVNILKYIEVRVYCSRLCGLAAHVATVLVSYT